MKVGFDGFVLDQPARRLTRDGRDVHLSPKAFDLLVLLVEARPAVVDKVSIRARLWPGVHVVEASLTNLVTEIRGELGPGLGTRIVRTVHGSGYAFGGELSEVGAGRAGATPAREAPYWLVWKDRPIVLSIGDNVIGRDATSAVWVDSTSVSRKHAVVRVPDDARDSSVTIQDLGSTNGTFVAGRRIKGVAEIADGDRVRVGQVSLTFRARPQGDAPTKRVRPPRRGGAQ